MALNAFSYILIVFGTVFPIFAVGAAIAFIWYFSSPEDYKRAWFPRIVIIIAFSLAFLSVFLLPLDIANSRLDAGLSYALGIIWQVFYGFVIFFVIIVVPFTIFYYEAEDPEQGILYQFKWASICTAISTLVVLIVVAVPAYWVMVAEIPYQAIVNDAFSNNIDTASNVGRNVSLLFHFN